MKKIKEIKIVNQDESTEIANIGADAQNVDYNDTTVKAELDKLNTTDNSLKNTQTNQGHILTDLQSQVSSLASGSPAGVYATVTALTTADPDHSKIYVITENGHWYYYNNNWIDGGVYQSAENSQTLNELIDQTKYIKNLQNKIQLNALNFERGGLNSDGQKYTNGYQFDVRSIDYIKIEQLTFPIIFNINSGFQFLIHYYSNNQDGTNYHITSSGWKTEAYELNTSYNYYKILIRRKPYDTSEIANVENFVNQLYIENNSLLFDTINNIKNQLYKEELPEYWKEYLLTKYSSINNKVQQIGNNGDFFGFFTDYHYPQNSKLTSNIIKAINENTLLNKFVNNGDILTTQTKTEAFDLLYKFKKDFENIKLFNVLGNHDLNTYASIENRLTISEVYPLLFKQYEDTYINLNKNLYYYFDNDTIKMRYVFLNTNYSESAFLRDLSQINWFIDVLNNTPENYGVIVFTHIFFGSVDNNYNLIESPVGERIRIILNAFNNKTAGSHSVSTSGAENTIYFDFTNAKGYVIAVITGHTHNDGFLEADGYYIIATLCDAYQGSNQNPNISRTQGTYSENAIDLFFINTTDKTINTVRIGAGEDRTFTYTVN